MNRNPLIEIAADLWRDKTGLFGLTVILFLIVVVAFGPMLTPHDPGAINLAARLKPPAWLEGGSWARPLGTDHLGRDVLSRMIIGARASLLVGASVTAIAGTFGSILGITAGYFGRRVDSAIMRLVDTQVAFPGLLLAIIILAVVGPKIQTVIVVLCINGWMVFARMARGIVLSVREAPYVEAAEVIGCHPIRVVLRHILPNLLAPMLTLAVLEFARVILAEAALSFLGVGVQPPDTSWGLDLATGKNYLFRAWWLVCFPGLAITVTVLGANLFANWLRVVADPHEREKLFAAAVVAEEGAAP